MVNHFIVGLSKSLRQPISPRNISSCSKGLGRTFELQSRNSGVIDRSKLDTYAAKVDCKTYRAKTNKAIYASPENIILKIRHVITMVL